MRESAYQAQVIARLELELPGCIVIKNDPAYIQGIPDLLVLIGDCWLMLEVKVSRHAPNRPNQAYYVDRLDDMSFAAFIYPENENEVFDAIQLTFGTHREARIS